MKAKTVLCLVTVLFVIIAITPSTMAPESPPAISVIFEDTQTTELVGPPPGVGQNFTVRLKIENISTSTPLWSWKVKVTWDPNVLEVAMNPDGSGQIIEGDFLKSRPGGTLFLFTPPNNELGQIPEMSCTRLVGNGVTGSGILAKITFHVKGFSMLEGIYINVLEVKALSYIPGTPPTKPLISIDILKPGHFTLPPPPPTPPKADFTPRTCLQFRLSRTTGNVTVDFDASSSMTGWDTLPTNESCPITQYRWDFNGDGTFDLIGNPTEARTPQWNYTSAEDVAVTLEVLAPDPTPPTHPLYTNTSRATHTIHILPPVFGAHIDIYTDKGGLGEGVNPVGGEPYPAPSGWSDAYGPQEQVTIYSLVTYNDEPVEYWLVTFEVKDPTGQIRVSRTAFTNSSGIANMTFRIPWIGSSAESLIGNWTIMGRAEIGDKVTTDICQFKFGYLVSIQSITVVSSPVHLGGTLIVTVDMRTLSFSSKSAYVTIVLYDELDVPIGTAEGYVTVDSEEGATQNYGIEIQEWSFVGIGTIYANVFTQPPDLKGIPYCPGASAIFIITVS